MEKVKNILLVLLTLSVIHLYSLQHKDDKSFIEVYKGSNVIINKLNETTDHISIIDSTLIELIESNTRLMKIVPDIIFKNDLKYTKSVEDSSFKYLYKLKNK